MNGEAALDGIHPLIDCVQVSVGSWPTGNGKGVREMTGMKYIRVITVGVKGLVDKTPGLLEKALRVFFREVHRVDDWIYVIEVDGYRFFAADNGEDGYTLMLPEEY